MAIGGALGAGIAVALSIPPFGWWPLAIVGLAAVAICLRRQPWRRRAAMGAALGLGQFAIGLWWVTEFSGPGYVALVLLSMVFLAIALALVAAWRPVGVVVGLPAALTLAEWARGHVPFGGLPLGGVALGQVAGPLAWVARVGGPILLTGVTAATGAGVGLLVAAAVARGNGRAGRGAVPAAGALAVVVALVVAGHLGPDGSGAGPHRSIRVAAVQGGGRRGLNAVETDANAVFQRQLDASFGVQRPVALVLWPEDVVTVDQPIGQTPEAATIARLAVRLHATVVAGVVEDVGATRFRNAAVAWSPAGVIVARYDKVHRVPFGEYIPDRGLFQHLANLDLVPRDAIAGHGPGLLTTPAGRLGVVISYEVFFEDRAREAIDAGGEVLLVPTNASSYRTSQVPTQEVAAARLRALESGRDVIQAAPTGYSALIDADGRVLVRSTLSRQQVITGRVTLRDGRTWFLQLGELPVLGVALLGLVATYGLVGTRPLFPTLRRPAGRTR